MLLGQVTDTYTRSSRAARTFQTSELRSEIYRSAETSVPRRAHPPRVPGSAQPAAIIPAPTVSFEASSIRMKLPVLRLLA